LLVASELYWNKVKENWSRTSNDRYSANWEDYLIMWRLESILSMLFMLSITILVNWIQIACLISVGDDGCKSSDDCFTMRWHLQIGLDIYHLNSIKNMPVTWLTHL